MLKQSLDRVELLESFEQFLQQGVQYLTDIEKAGSGDRPVSVDSSTAVGAGADKDMGLSTGLPRAEVLQRVRDVLLDVQLLRDKLSFGREGSDVYSSKKEDYDE